MVNFSVNTVLFLNILFLSLVLHIIDYIFQFHWYSKGLPYRFTWSGLKHPRPVAPQVWLVLSDAPPHYAKESYWLPSFLIPCQRNAAKALLFHAVSEYQFLTQLSSNPNSYVENPKDWQKNSYYYKWL